MATGNNHLDVELVSRLRGREHAAFTEIYNRYWQVMITHAMAILKDHEQALDVVQDVFTNLWNRCDTLSIETDLKSYLYAATRNQCLKVINRNRLLDDFAEALVRTDKEYASTTDDAIHAHELEILLEIEMAKLPPKVQAIFRKSREEGLSHKAIAEEMGMAENSVKSTIHRTLVILRKKLKPFLPVLFCLFR